MGNGHWCCACMPFNSLPDYSAFNVSDQIGFPHFVLLKLIVHVRRISHRASVLFLWCVRASKKKKKKKLNRTAFSHAGFVIKNGFGYSSFFIAPVYHTIVKPYSPWFYINISNKWTRFVSCMFYTIVLMSCKYSRPVAVSLFLIIRLRSCLHTSLQKQAVPWTHQHNRTPIQNYGM